jgi:hypothetical protein
MPASTKIFQGPASVSAWPPEFDIFRHKKPQKSFLSVRKRFRPLIRSKRDSLTTFFEDDDDLEPSFSLHLVKGFCSTVEWHILDNTWQDQKRLLSRHPEAQNIWHQDQIIDPFETPRCAQCISHSVPTGSSATQLLKYLENGVRNAIVYPTLRIFSCFRYSNTIYIAAAVQLEATGSTAPNVRISFKHRRNCRSS